MDRRDFLKKAALVGAACFIDFRLAFAQGTEDNEVGKAWKGWKKGQFQIHLIFTGVAESMFLIFPDGTTMLIDCGDFDALARGELAVPLLPSPERHSGEWISRYVQRVNPQKNYVDYMMLSHYHADHGGCDKFYAKKEIRDGKDYYIGGFSHAAEFLTLGKAIDRCWPDYNDPIPLTQEAADAFDHMKSFYDYMSAHKKLEIEKFRIGETDQIAMKKDVDAFPDFSVRNICANGRIADRNGNIRDLYEERKKSNPVKLNENGMSMGMIFTYGNFKFYTAGDFSDSWKLPNGERFEIENALAEVVEPVTVAKINHHGHHSMPAKLVSALRPRVFVNNVWDQLHTVAPVMERLYSRDLYPGDRIVCPTVFPAERRAEDAGKPWLDILNPASFDAGHVIVNVEEGGRDYSVTYLTADDESMIVKSVMRFDN